MKHQPDTGRVDTYDAFVSHATDPDSELARRVKAELEAFHKRSGVQQRYFEATDQKFEPIRLCVDGQDFVFPKSDPQQDAPIDTLVRDYLVRSRGLLVLSGAETTKHPWINKEIDWYRELCPHNDIHFALTHGPDPARQQDFVPPALGDVNLGLFSDLRGFYHETRKRWGDYFHHARSERMQRVAQSARSWISVRNFDEELARLAARLLSNRGHRDFAVEDLERGFEIELRRSRQRRRAARAAVAMVLFGLLMVLTNTFWMYWEEQRLRTNRVWTSQADLFRRELDASLMDSLALSANAIANGDREDGPRGMVETLQRLVKSERLYQREGDPGPVEAGKRRAHIETLTELQTGGEVLLGGIDGHLVLFDTVARKELAEVFLAHTRILDIAVLPGGEEIAVGTRSGLFFVRLTRNYDGPILDVITRSVSDEDVFGVAYDPSWDRIVGGRLDGRVVAFDRPAPGQPWEGRTLYTLLDSELAEPGHEPDIPASISAFKLRHLPDGTSRAYLASFSHFVAAIDLGEDSATEVWPEFFNEDTSLTSMDVDEGGELVLVTDLDGRIFLIDGRTGETISEIRPYRADPASLAVDPSGAWGFARPDVLGNVGIDLHPSGLLFGVSSHDHTTKFFDTGTLNSGGFSAAVHNEMARDIRFSSDGQTGYSMSNDGTLQRVSLFETYEALRLMGIDRGHPLSARDGTLILTPDEGGPLLWSPGLNVRSVPGLPAAPHNWSTLPREAGNLIFFGADTRLFTVTSEGAKDLCDGRSIEDILDLNESKYIRTVHPLGRDGELVFAPIDADRETIQLFLFTPETCSGFAMSRDGYPEDAKIFVAEDFAAVIPGSDRAIAWRRTDNGFAAEEFVATDTTIDELAFGPGGSPLLAVLDSDDQHQQTLCLCGAGWSLSSVARGRNDACQVLTLEMSCTAAEVPGHWQASAVGSIHASPSGRFFIVRGPDAELGLLKVPRWPWQRPRVRSVAPKQTRPIRAPFAFNETEDVLAVPNGDMGIRILDPSNLSVLSVLPTPSRVYALTFEDTYLISTDGANEDAIIRVQPWQPADILQRACEYWPEGSVATIPPGVPDILQRSNFCVE